MNNLKEIETAPKSSGPNREDAGANRQGSKPFYKKYKFWMLVFVIIYSITTIALWCQTKRATEATKLSADAQVATVRAWIWPVNWHWNPLPSFADVQAGKCSPATFQFRNIGHTLATNPRLDIFQAVYHANSAPDLAFPDCPDKPGPENGQSSEALIILPGDGPNMVHNVTLPPDQYDALTKGDATLFLTGCVYYNVASSEQLGISQLCVQWRPDKILSVCHGNNYMK